MSVNEKSHNLDIHMYSLKDLLSLFHTDYNINLEDLKRAKKQVLMTHPDKSKLLAEYFLFYKKAFDKLEIEPLVFRVGQYKSAVEPFIRENMSPENKMQTQSFISSINREVFSKISVSKKISANKLNQIADSLLAMNPVKAEKLGMIKLGYWDQFESLLKSAVKIYWLAI